mmetsp:Transcript_14149/g.20897  ORF Transcript_14149/g.20897 Transcript_14149/m.20897 type:complete len:167 (-) Transcript_14149:139-639(-)|eukprot:CAMPEP_0194201484 /NCGR_PEP_ID=MMETSP0156-20130528/1738_1 /TAXON_ID=33649 /ORGANISM="Thalassionema nitzschioides, Strain L26-B" /LENGTH=166 /DNA_ID=CAMNT_0038926681 /DNA_START=135 /DNA_END=635 /DNA_ORIENTATION=+
MTESEYNELLLTESEYNELIPRKEEKSSLNTFFWKSLYPGFMRKAETPVDTPPKGAVFVKTGGNALQAIDCNILQQEHVVEVTVPKDKQAGYTILVTCPYNKDLVVPTIIPQDALPGDTFLVRIMPENERHSLSSEEQIVAGATIGSKIAAKAALMGLVTSKAIGF